MDNYPEIKDIISDSRLDLYLIFVCGDNYVSNLQQFLLFNIFPYDA